jgi:hypothetical protein
MEFSFEMKENLHEQTFDGMFKVFWLGNLNKSTPLKPLGQINRNMAGSIYGMSSMKIAHFVSIG